MSSFVEITGLSKAYRRGDVRVPVLEEVAVRFERGSFTAIVGPSGCGKTTLLGLLGALDTADAGRLVVDGLDLVRASRKELVAYRRTVGIVFQFYNLLPTLTAVENVESSLEFTSLGPSARRQRALEHLARVGMADLATRFPAQLSGGQQQRVAVARVLAREPRLLLADEPTGNLDDESSERIFECIRSLQRETGVTCVMVTHDHALAQRLDGVVRLQRGRVLACDDREVESGVVLVPRSYAGGRSALYPSSHRRLGGSRA